MNCLQDKKNITVLAIESSCDETACALVRNGREVLSATVASQIDIHRRYGGVVPEIASRNHTLAIENVVKQAMADAHITKDGIDAVAVTYGAGLLGALLVGVNFAKALAYAWEKPLFAISHVRGHLAANYIDSNLEPPYLCLLASGGHTAIVKVEDYEKVELVCQSRDDAAGEAFDKTARILGLPYPGGPEIERAAKGGSAVYDMPIHRFSDSDELFFSYSGLKTFVINLVHKLEQNGLKIPVGDIAASFQNAAVSQLVDVLEIAKQRNRISKIAIAGGVSANAELRKRLDKFKVEGCEVFYPQLKYCTDNAAMIGAAAYFKIRSGAEADGLELDAKATVSIE
jgi:N6-L-threonylcarbamoyladenine synthase